MVRFYGEPTFGWLPMQYITYLRLLMTKLTVLGYDYTPNEEGETTDSTVGEG